MSSSGTVKGDPVVALRYVGGKGFGIGQADLKRVSYRDPEQKSGHNQGQQEEQKTLPGRRCQHRTTPKKFSLRVFGFQIFLLGRAHRKLKTYDNTARTTRPASVVGARQQEIVALVHAGRPSRRHHGGGVELEDDSRAIETVAGPQANAIIAGSCVGAIRTEPDRLGGHVRCLRVGRAGLFVRQIQFGAGARTT